LSATYFSKVAWLESSSALSLPDESYKFYLISPNLAMTSPMADGSANSCLMVTAIKAFKKAVSTPLSLEILFWVICKVDLAFLT